MMDQLCSLSSVTWIGDQADDVTDPAVVQMRTRKPVLNGVDAAGHKSLVCRCDKDARRLQADLRTQCFGARETPAVLGGRIVVAEIGEQQCSQSHMCLISETVIRVMKIEF
ncbi:hypothetical protein [Amycolatopsis sp. GM8]|uniref:hypothetical protein n=1 Tax=Amycolatopsis sp. GM8 TaxID=2896530 RepID=UPI001F2F6B79|nr:hypothetical protein [Amycolatopsis sp. GM8]